MIPANAIPALEELLEIKKGSGMPAPKVSVNLVPHGRGMDERVRLPVLHLRIPLAS
jgi:hypothetical protein